VVSVAVCGEVTCSIYDKILQLRRLPYLPSLPYRVWHKTAGDIMSRTLNWLVPNSTPKHVARILSTTTNVMYPIINNPVGMVVVGSAERKDLLQWLIDCKEVPDTVTVHQVHESYGTFLSAFKESFFFTKHVHNVLPGQIPKEHKSRSKRDVSTKKKAAPTPEEGKGDVDEARDYTPMPTSSPPIQLLKSTPLPHIHMLFITLRLNEAFVTDKGRLVGIVYRESIKNVVEGNEFSKSNLMMDLFRWATSRWFGHKKDKSETFKKPGEVTHLLGGDSSDSSDSSDTDSATSDSEA